MVEEGLPFVSYLFCLYSDSGSQSLKLLGQNELTNKNIGLVWDWTLGQTHTHPSCLRRLFHLNHIKL